VLEPVTTQDLLHLHNQEEPHLVDHLLESVPAGERARQRDALIRAAGQVVNKWSTRAVARFLLTRLVTLQANPAPFIDVDAAPDGPLSAALLWNGRRVPSLSAVRRAIAPVAHETESVSRAS